MYNTDLRQKRVDPFNFKIVDLLFGVFLRYMGNSHTCTLGPEKYYIPHLKFGSLDPFGTFSCPDLLNGRLNEVTYTFQIVFYL